MGPGEVVQVAIPTTLLTGLGAWLGPMLVRWVKEKNGRGRIDTPTSMKLSSTSDARMRAAVHTTGELVEQLHEALGKRSDTGGYIILEMFKSLVGSMSQQTRILEEQTHLLKQLVDQKRSPDGRYANR